MSTRGSTARVRCRNAARPTAYANGAPLARMTAARRASFTAVASTSASRFATGQKRGTSSTAATMSRASSRASATPACSRLTVSSASRAPNEIGAAVSVVTEVLLVGSLLQGLDDAPQIAVENPLQIVHREIDAVVRDPTLRKVVRADLRRPIAGPDLRLAHARPLGFLLCEPLVQQPGA